MMKIIKIGVSKSAILKAFSRDLPAGRVEVNFCTNYLQRQRYALQIVVEVVVVVVVEVVVVVLVVVVIVVVVLVATRSVAFVNSWCKNSLRPGRPPGPCQNPY